MAYSWEEDSENPSRFKGALSFILTIGFAVGFGMEGVDADVGGVDPGFFDGRFDGAERMARAAVGAD